MFIAGFRKNSQVSSVYGTVKIATTNYIKSRINVSFRENVVHTAVESLSTTPRPRFDLATV